MREVEDKKTLEKCNGDAFPFAIFGVTSKV